MKPKALTREQLRQLVEGECEEIEANDDATDADLTRRRKWNAALHALDELDAGRTPLVFRASRINRNGRDPGAVKALQLKAVLHVEALRRIGSSLENAIADVAEMYDKDSETLEGWHRKLQEEDPDRVRLANKVAANHHRMRMPRLTKAQVLNSAKHDGERMRVAQVPKRVKVKKSSHS